MPGDEVEDGALAIQPAGGCPHAALAHRTQELLQLGRAMGRAPTAVHHQIHLFLWEDEFGHPRPHVIALTDAAKIGWVLQALGALAWSCALLREVGLGRIVGVVGIGANLLVGAAVLGSGVNMTMASILSVLLAQLVWNLAAAGLLVRAPRWVAASERVLPTPRPSVA